MTGSVMNAVSSPLDHLGKSWWLVALRGVLAIVFGLLAFFYPGATLLVLIAFFGAYMFVDGVLALVQAMRFRHDRDQWPMLLIEGILGIVAGLITFFLPGAAALAWVITIAAWALVSGVLEILAAIKLRQFIRNEIFLALSGVVSILLGIGFILLPAIGLLAAVWMVGAYAIIFGVILLSLAYRLRPRATGTPTAAMRGV
jgi:uncharacterized membrane protein HdeD (DUF308 family)